MATLQTRNGSHRIIFQYEGEQQTLAIGRVSNTEAIQWKSKVEHLLMRLKQRLLEVPQGCTIEEFMRHDGKPPVPSAFTMVKNTTLHELREAYLAIFANGAVEANTLYMARIHLNHVEKTYGKNFLLSALTLPRLQEHITRRQNVVEPITIKKELDTFRAVWNWGSRNGQVVGPFPCKGLVYPKGEEKPPFMSWSEIERRVKAGGDPDKLWDALYLRPEEIAEFLKFTQDNANRDWLYPFLVTAAYTGARRSELIRMRTEDVNLDESVITIREKKRSQGTRTSRQVPIAPKVAKVLEPMLADRIYLFGNGDVPITVADTQKAWYGTYKRSKWQVVRGYHVCRHSFISACASKGIDQRMLQAWAGHMSPEMSRRYTHLYPSTQAQALNTVFG